MDSGAHARVHAKRSVSHGCVASRPRVCRFGRGAAHPDVAVLRLLLAVLQTVFYRVDPEGNPSPLEDEEEAIDRWGQLWQKKQLPEKPILEYLAAWQDRFWLFHPERPFYQVETLKNELSLERRSSMARFHKAKIKCGYFPVIPGLKKII